MPEPTNTALPAAVIAEAQRCLNCKNPRCSQGCPISTPIPDVIRMALNGQEDEAGRILFENNPLTTVCAKVCDHERQCEGHCILGKKGKPVRFSQIEDALSSAYSRRMTRGPAEPNGMHAAIIGAGPAGLTIAVQLARKGFGITIFERRAQIGGVLRYGIPDFRLPREIIDDFAYRHLILKDIRVRPNTSIGAGGALGIDDLLADGYDAIFVGTGVWQPRRLNVPGETQGHVHYAIHYLASPAAYDLGRHVVVVGAGNAAMDVCRTALRAGTGGVTCLARGQSASASQKELSAALAEGMQLRCGVRVTQIGRKDVGIISVDGEGRDCPGSEDSLPADSVIISISQGPRSLIVSTTQGLEVNERGLLVTDDCGRTTRPGIFAGGDVVAGARTVVEAVAASKRVAEAMEIYMRGRAAQRAEK